MKRSPAALVLAFTLAVRAAIAAPHKPGPGDAQAEKVLKKALESDFLETRFDDAEQKLKKAIETCKKTKCSKRMVARLHAALGSVLAGGKKELTDAQDAFVDALTADPTIQPDPDVSSQEVTFAFEQAKKKLKLMPADPPPPEPVKDDKKPGEKGASCDADKPCAEGLACNAGACGDPKPKPAPKKNWVSITFFPDVSFISGKDVCAAETQAAEQIVCLRGDQSRYRGTPTIGNADNINLGAALATMRLVLGYDRVLIDNLVLGIRLGYAFRGVSDGGVSFLPVHAEARLSFFPGKKPFEGWVARPSLFLAGGLAQIDTKVLVNVLEDGVACGAMNPSDTRSACTKPSKDGIVEPRTQELAAVKRAGLGFASLGFGLDLVPTNAFAFHLGVRGTVTFPVLTAVLQPEAGLMVGF